METRDDQNKAVGVRGIVQKGSGLGIESFCSWKSAQAEMSPRCGDKSTLIWLRNSKEIQPVADQGLTSMRFD